MQTFAFTLPDCVSGAQVTLPVPSAEAPVAVVIFTCNHCPYAMAYEGRIKQLAKDLRTRDIPFFAISSNDPIQYPQDGPEAMRTRALEKSYGFPYLFDETQEIARLFGAEKTPHAFVLAGNGNQWRIHYSGAIDDNDQHPLKVERHYVQEAIDQVLSDFPGEAWQTAPVGCGIKWKK